MRQIINFIIKYKHGLLFVFLQFIALFFTVQNHSYHRSRFINSANTITGGIYKRSSSVNEYMNLRTENKKLADENTRLKNLLYLSPIYTDSLHKIVVDFNLYYQTYKFVPAKTINNSYTKRNNYLTLNKGENDGIGPEMGVANSRGIIGVTKSVSKHYSTVISVLNENSRIHAKFKNNNHFGTLYWDGEDYKIVQLHDIPRQAKFKLGDTIITGGKSTIFPEGIPIGTIKDFSIQNHTYDRIDVELFNDMSAISNVNVISNLNKLEIQNLESQNNE